MNIPDITIEFPYLGNNRMDTTNPTITIAMSSIRCLYLLFIDIFHPCVYSFMAVPDVADTKTIIATTPLLPIIASRFYSNQDGVLDYDE
ncbi:hypothetical protein [Candidatus Methanomassiliicoccus intestinalis]|uniref:hypothetical protein n=1 Tax=Candidatus Methanomassiliicoccus intestinalis TaxID=1406512 RepID=UPI0037DD8E59